MHGPMNAKKNCDRVLKWSDLVHCDSLSYHTPTPTDIYLIPTDKIAIGNSSYEIICHVNLFPDQTSLNRHVLLSLCRCCSFVFDSVNILSNTDAE